MQIIFVNISTTTNHAKQAALLMPTSTWWLGKRLAASSEPAWVNKFPAI
jgi:hypothetical protein